MRDKDVAIVTGAASGIGKATAHLLLEKGYQVYGTSRRAVPDAPAGVTMLVCDVTDDASVAAMVRQVETAAGRIDLLVNNAGVGLFGGAEESSMDQVRGLFDINVFGVARTVNAVLPVMRRQGAGRIVNVSSVQGFIPAPYFAHYGATKHAVEGYSQSLDHELRPLGIRVMLVQPAYTRTAFEENLVRADRPVDIYDPARRSMTSVVAEAMRNGDDPQIVAATILEAARDARPRLRYPAGKVARRVSLLRRFAPAAAFDKSLRKMLRLPT